MESNIEAPVKSRMQWIKGENGPEEFSAQKEIPKIREAYAQLIELEGVEDAGLSLRAALEDLLIKLEKKSRDSDQAVHQYERNIASARAEKKASLSTAALIKEQLGVLVRRATRVKSEREEYEKTLEEKKPKRGRAKKEK